VIEEVNVYWHKKLNHETPLKDKHWLTYAGSFMQRLKAHGIRDAKIEVLEQSWQLPHFSERKLLMIDFRSVALVREVLILSEKKIWMYARSLIPRHMIKGEYQQLAHLKTRALGSVLFKNKKIKRSDFEFMCLKNGMTLHEKVKKYIDQDTLWARRSLFSNDSKSLLLMEIFTSNTLNL
jgi:chorismate lyase